MSTDVQADATKAVDAGEKAVQDPAVTTVLDAGQSALAVEHDFAPLIPAVVKESKAGYKTTEFWLTLVAAFVTAVGAIPTPHDAKGFVVAGIVVAYALARGLAKNGVADVEADPAAGAPSVGE